jgi:hypothetical protein
MKAFPLFMVLLLSSSVVRAETLWSISALEQLQHTSLGHGGSLRGAYRYNDTDSLGLVLRAAAVPSDFRGGFALAIHGALNFRHQLGWTPGAGLAPFVGSSLGVGFWTACVWPERCGGYGPSLGVELGTTWPISRYFRLISSMQVDAHSSWFAGEETISMLSLNLGVEY